MASQPICGQGCHKISRMIYAWSHPLKTHVAMNSGSVHTDQHALGLDAISSHYCSHAYG